MTFITVTRKVIVPQKDIRDTIASCKKWFEKNPEREICNASIFGHTSWKVHRTKIEEDINKAASLAKPYNKI